MNIKQIEKEIIKAIKIESQIPLSSKQGYRCAVGKVWITSEVA